ncbi:MAG: ABC transporter ATP-binding protein [Acidobacteriaceae bacterium]|nr:ABC transporter ATP-binding protein [Acidobacteriaceae bacterium]
MQPLLELRGLTKDFATHRAIDTIALAIARGEFFSLLGPSGCGKTTTLRCIAGFETPNAGDILLDGRSLVPLPPYRRNVNTVFQNYAVFPHLTVQQNVAFGLERRGVNNGAITRKVRDALALVELTGKETRYPNQISGGEKQRVALARALVLEPELLLLDEPLSALDPKLRKQMRIELKTLQARVGITFLFVTHDQEEALSLSDSLAVMNSGRIEQVGTPRELYRQPASRFVAEFLGEINWIDQVALRPESLNISKNHPGGGIKALPATVQTTTFLGNRTQLRTTLANGRECVIEVQDAAQNIGPGEQVHVWWRTSDEIHIPNP